MDAEILKVAKERNQAIELLKNLVQYLEWREDFIVEDASEGEENDYCKAIEFLKSIKEL